MWCTKQAPTTVENMKNRTVDACASITPETFTTVSQSDMKRAQWCCNSNGLLFEYEYIVN